MCFTQRPSPFGPVNSQGAWYYTTTRALTLDAARGGGTLSLIQADLANITTNNGTIVLGSVDAGATRAASIAINVPVDVTASTLALQLFAQGDVVANGPGGLAGGHLAAASSGGLLLGQANAVDRIDALIANAGIVFGDTKDLTVTGPVSAGLLAADGHAGFDGTIQLSSTGAVTLGGDVLALARQVSGAPPTSLTGITIAAGTTLTQAAGTVGTDAGMALAAGSGLTQNAGLLTSGGTLVATTGGALTLSGGTISAFGDIGLTGASVIQSGGLVGAIGALTVRATGGDVMQTAGVIAARGIGPTIGATGNVTQTGGLISGDAIFVSAGGTEGVGFLQGRPVFTSDGAAPFYPGVIGLAPGTAPSTLVLKGAAVNVLTALTATTSIELDATAAAVAESGAGSLTTATLQGAAMTAVSLGGGNSVGRLADVTVGTRAAPGAFSLANVPDLAVTGTVSVPGGSIVVTESGKLTLAGTITAGTQSLTAGGMIQQTVGSIVVPAGDLVLTAGQDGLALAGTITNATGRVALQTPGAIGQTGGTLTAGMLDDGGVAAASLSLPQPTNEVRALAGFATAGPSTLVDAAPLAVTGPVVAHGAVGLTAAALSLDGTISGATVSLNGTGGVIQTAGTVSATGAVMVVSGGDITQAAAGVVKGATAGITAAGAITVAGLVSATGGDAALTTTAGAITQDAGTISASGAATLGSGASVTQVAGTIAGATVGITATTAIITSGTISATAEPAALTASAGAIAQSVGISSARGDIDLRAGSIALAGMVTTPRGTLRLLTAGAITQPGGSIAAATLTTGPGTTTPSSVMLMQPGNQIATLGDLATAGDFALIDGRALTLAGVQTIGGIAAITTEAGGIAQARCTLTAANASLVAGIGSTPGSTDIALGGALVVTGTLQLDTSGAIVQASGSIAAATLTDLPRFNTADGPVALTAPGPTGNHVANLASFTSDGFALQDSQTLTVTGPVNAGPGALTLNVAIGGLNLTGALNAGTTTLTAQGTIVQGAGSVIGATGATTLSAGGAIDQAGAINRRRGRAHGPWRCAGQRRDDHGHWLDGGARSHGGAGDPNRHDHRCRQRRAGYPLGERRDQLGRHGGCPGRHPRLADAGRHRAAARLHHPRDPERRGRRRHADAGCLGRARAGGQQRRHARGVRQRRRLLAHRQQKPGAGRAGRRSRHAVADRERRSGAGRRADRRRRGRHGDGGISQSGGFVTANAGNLALLAGGAITLGGFVVDQAGTVRLIAGGSITQPGGTLVAGGLTGSAAAASLAQASNSVGALQAFTTSGDITLADAATLTIAGPVLAGGVATITGTAGIVAAGNVAGGAVAIGATGTLTQQSGVISATAGPLALAAGGDVVQQGGASIIGGTVDVAVTGQIALGGTLGGAGVVLAAGGPIIGTGTITAATLSGSSQSYVRLGNGANSIVDIAGLSAGGLLVLADGRSLTVGGPLAAGGAMAIGVIGDLGVSGTVSGPSVAMTATGGLGQSGSIAGTAGDVALGAGTGALMQSGSVSGANITLSGGAAAGLILGGSLATPGTLLLLTNGVVAQPGGGITAGLLTTGSSLPSSVTLTQPANQIAALGQFATVGDTTIAVAGNLSLVSTLDARNVALAAGSIDQSGIISADNVALQASGPIVLNGTVASAGVLRLLTPGDVTQTGGAVLAKLLTTDIPAASISLPQAGNQVQALGPVMVTGKLSLVDGRSLAITGPVTAGTLTLTTGAGAGTNGSLGVAGDLAAGASATFVTASDFNQVSGTITAPEIVQTAGAAPSSRARSSRRACFRRPASA